MLEQKLTKNTNGSSKINKCNKSFLLVGANCIQSYVSE